MTPRMDGPAWVMLLLLSLLWGGSFVLTEVILEGLPVVTMVALRVLLATLTLWTAVAILRVPPPTSRAAWSALVVMGLFNNVVPFLLIAWGQTAITGGLAAVLNATTPIFTGVAAGIFLADERLTGAKVIGLLLGLVGVAVVIGPDAFHLGADVWAELAILGAACAYAGTAVFARRFATLGLRPLLIAAGQTTISSLVLVPLAFVVDRPLSLPVPGIEVWLCVVALGCLSTALAYIFFFAILARAGATNVVLVTVLIPVVAVLVGAVTLGEPVGVGQIAGMALIFTGLTVIDGRLWRRLFRPPATLNPPAPHP